MFIIPAAKTATVLLLQAAAAQNSSSVCIVGMSYDTLNGSHARSHKLYFYAHFFVLFFLCKEMIMKNILRAEMRFQQQNIFF